MDPTNPTEAPDTCRGWGNERRRTVQAHEEANGNREWGRAGEQKAKIRGRK